MAAMLRDSAVVAVVAVVAAVVRAHEKYRWPR